MGSFLLPPEGVIGILSLSRRFVGARTAAYKVRVRQAELLHFGSDHFVLWCGGANRGPFNCRCPSVDVKYMHVSASVKLDTAVVDSWERGFAM
jgi:hypothetical protein